MRGYRSWRGHARPAGDAAHVRELRPAPGQWATTSDQPSFTVVSRSAIRSTASKSTKRATHVLLN